MHEASFFRRFWGGAVSMPIKTLFFVYLFWIKFCLSERLRDCTLVHSLSLICYLIFKYCVYSNMYTLKIWQEHFDVHKKHNSQLTQKPHPPRYVNVSKHLFIVIVHMLLSNKMLYWHSYPYQNEASGDDDFGNNISKVFWSILILTF